ncbi:hypothetical protein ACEWY4_016109 [Coilia grayii]|uniref:Peptidase A2 domain-containing protein n=1 Tax=Coilia grayii TaxID=363190 RepID=A0ABD1JQU8_9TELE
MGHIKPKCPNRKPKAIEGTGELDSQQESLVEVVIRGRRLKALIDTGSSQTLVGARWVPKDTVQTELPVQIRCVHGDVRSYPTADIYMQIAGQEYLVTVGVAEHLPHPVVLGRDIPGLVHLMDPVECNMVGTRAKVKEAGPDV